MTGLAYNIFNRSKGKHKDSRVVAEKANLSMLEVEIESEVSDDEHESEDVKNVLDIGQHQPEISGSFRY